MKSKKLSAQRPGNRSNSSASNGSSDDLTTRNVEIIKQLEDAAKQERTKSDLVAEAIANFCGSMTFTTEIDVEIVREGKNFKGRLLGAFLGIVGKGQLEKVFARSLKAIEARDYKISVAAKA
jgi:hypothetical protein